MAHFRKLPSGNFQAIVKGKGLKTLCATFPTKTKAKQWANAVESDTVVARKLSVGDNLSLAQAVNVATHSGSLHTVVPSFPQFVDEYIENTSIPDRSMIGRLNFWKHKFQNKLVIDVTPEDIDDILLSIRDSRTGSTVNRYKSNLSSIFMAFNRHPSYRRLKFPNPVRSEFVSTFRENRAKTRFLSPEEQRTLLTAARSSTWEQMYLLVLMALTTGARRGELMKLTWADLDLSSKIAYLRTSKNNEPRILPLLAPVVEELAKFAGNPDHLIFPSTIHPHRPFNFDKALRRALKDACITNVRFHDLRHTAASNMVASNRTLFETGTLLGHKQSSTTMRYAHLAHQHTSKMAEDVWKGIHGE